MSNQDVNRPERASRSVKRAVMEGSREPLKGALYRPTDHHPSSYRRTVGAPTVGEPDDLFEYRPLIRHRSRRQPRTAEEPTVREVLDMARPGGKMTVDR